MNTEKDSSEREMETTDFIVREIDQDTISIEVKSAYTLNLNEALENKPINVLKIGGFEISVGQNIRGAIVTSISKESDNKFIIHSNTETL